MKVLVTIPIYNEASQLERQMQILDTFLAVYPNVKSIFDFEILDNNSDDQSPSILEKLSLEYDWLTFQRINTKGVGAALQHSWTSLQYSHYGYMDLDFSTDLATLFQVQEYLLDFPMVVGSRFLPESHVSGRKLSRQISSWSLNRLAQLYFSNTLSDLMCGFKFIDASLYRSISKKLTQNTGWFYCAEVLLAIDFLGLKVKEIPVIWTESSRSNVKILSLSLEYIRNMFELKRNFKHLSKINS